MTGSRGKKVNLGARVMIIRYSDQAGREAARKADEQLEQGSIRGRDFWQDIKREIDRLQAEAPEETGH